MSGKVSIIIHELMDDAECINFWLWTPQRASSHSRWRKNVFKSIIISVVQYSRKHDFNRRADQTQCFDISQRANNV